jgi:hypothetical protein
VDETDRLISLAYYAPSLLTHEEQVIWKVIATSAYFWKGQYYDDVDEEVWGWNPHQEHNLVMDRLRKHWNEVVRVANDEVPRDDYFALKTRLVRGKTVSSTKSGETCLDDDLDSDCPF